MRSASHAGSWYAAEAAELSNQISKLISIAGSETSPTKALIVPHAGYRYSGQTAAWAFKAVDTGSISRVFVIGPCHFQYVDGCALPDSSLSHYSTPLGPIPLDLEVIRELRGQQDAIFGVFKRQDDEEEHSIEMQLPFIRHIFGARADLRLVPIYVGSLVQSEERLYGRVLAKYFDDPSSLFIISSDFCHWGHRFRFTPRGYPIVEPLTFQAGTTSANIESLDRLGMGFIASQDAEGFHKYLQTTGNTICGRNSILILLEVLRYSQIKVHVDFLHYSQSGFLQDSDSRDDSSVSYAAAVATVYFTLESVATVSKNFKF
jgi:AmmeMemoRadiSam system protein B